MLTKHPAEGAVVTTFHQLLSLQQPLAHSLLSPELFFRSSHVSQPVGGTNMFQVFCFKLLSTTVF